MPQIFQAEHQLDPILLKRTVTLLLVFPMGMYTVCTFRLAQATDLEFLMFIPKYFIFVALIAWFAAIFGLVHRLVAMFLNNPITSSNGFKQAPVSK